jgi:RNA polymerase sigma-70 factor (ECF subfamily)
MDAASFVSQVKTDYPRMVRSVTLYCGDRAVAEDAVQEALARAWERTSRGEVISSLPGWVAVVATNQTRSVARREARRASRAADLAPAATRDEMAQVGESDAVRRAVLLLPRRQREVIVLHYYLDRPIREVADLLRLSEGAVKNALHNARKHLADTLGAHEAEEQIDVR